MSFDECPLYPRKRTLGYYCPEGPLMTQSSRSQIVRISVRYATGYDGEKPIQAAAKRLNHRPPQIPNLPSWRAGVIMILVLEKDAAYAQLTVY